MSPADLKINRLNPGYCSVAVVYGSDREVESLCVAHTSVVHRADKVLRNPSVDCVLACVESLLPDSLENDR